MRLAQNITKNTKFNTKVQNTTNSAARTVNVETRVGNKRKRQPECVNTKFVAGEHLYY